MNEDLFVEIAGKLYPNTKGMVRRNDPNTSHEAAQGVVRRNISNLQREVMEAFEAKGPMTDSELEELPQFVRYAYSTVRKRRTELYQKGELVMCDFERANKYGSTMKVWDLPHEAQ